MGFDPMPDTWPRNATLNSSVPGAATNTANFRLDEPALMTSTPVFN